LTRFRKSGYSPPRALDRRFMLTATHRGPSSRHPDRHDDGRWVGDRPPQHNSRTRRFIADGSDGVSIRAADRPRAEAATQRNRLSVLCLGGAGIRLWTRCVWPVQSLLDPARRLCDSSRIAQAARPRFDPIPPRPAPPTPYIIKSRLLNAIEQIARSRRGIQPLAVRSGNLCG